MPQRSNRARDPELRWLDNFVPGIANHALFVWRSARAMKARVKGGWMAPTLSRASEKYVPRRGGLMHVPVGIGSPPGMIEPAATKEIPTLANFGNVITATRTTGQADLAGGITAILLTEDGTPATEHFIGEAGLTVAANTRTASSFYARRGTGTRNIQFRMTTGANWYGCLFNLSTGAVTPDKGGDGTAPTDAQMTLVGDWWYCTMTGIHSAAVANPNYNMFMQNGATITYNGDGASSIYLAHEFCVEADYSTSYIGGAATTTRSADTLSFDSASLFGSVASEGTLWGICVNPYKPSDLSAAQYVVALDYNNDFNDAAGGSVYLVSLDTTDRKIAFAIPGAGAAKNVQADTLGDHAANLVVAFAISWKSDATRLVINGALEGTDTGGAPLNLDRLQIANLGNDVGADAGQYPLVGVMDRYLTDAEAKLLTGERIREFIMSSSGLAI